MHKMLKGGTSKLQRWRRKTKTFNDAITLACEGLTWQQNTQKKRLCLKLGFDGKSEDKACRVFGDEPIDNDNGITVKDLCARIERLNTKITNGIDSLKTTTKALITALINALITALI